MAAAEAEGHVTDSRGRSAVALALGLCQGLSSEL